MCGLGQIQFETYTGQQVLVAPYSTGQPARCEAPPHLPTQLNRCDLEPIGET